MNKICLKTVSDTLSNSEMKQVTGGDGHATIAKDICNLIGANMYNCSCTNGASISPWMPTWSACYITEKEITDALKARCVYSGTCTRAY